MTETGKDLPAGWAKATLNEIGSWTGGGTPSKQQPAFWTDGTIPWVSPKDMKTDFLSETEDTITERAVEESSAKLVEAGSVLFVTRSGILRHTLPVAVNPVDVTVNQDLKALTPGTGIEPAYVLRFVQAFNREMLHATAKDGTTVQSVQTKKLYDYLIPVAPTAEQRRIVDALEAAFADLDAGIAAIDAAQRDLRRYRRSVLKAAVEGALTADWRRQHPGAEPASALLERVLEERRERWEADQLATYEAKDKAPPKNWRQRYKLPAEADKDGLPELPEGWMWSTMDQLTETAGGLTVNSKRKRFDLELPYLRVANVYADELRLDVIKEIGVAPPEVQRYALESGDLLIVEGNGSIEQIGRVAQWDGSIDPCLHQNHLIRSRPLLGSLGAHLLLWLLSPSGRDHIISVASSTSGLHTLSISNVQNIPVPLPPESELIAITEAVDERLSVADAAAAELDRQRIRADRLRQAVLKRAFAGELVPQGPTDEPASVLLQRVKKELAERKKTMTSRKRKRTMSKPEPTPPASLVEIVEANGPTDPHDLWKRSGIETIDAFYADLKTEVEAGLLTEQVVSPSKRMIVRS